VTSSTSQPESADLLDVLELEELEVNLYRANLVLKEERPLCAQPA
jgi:hypothetical protein